MAKPEEHIAYHASPDPHLEKKGIRTNVSPTVTNKATNWIYLGSQNYLKDQYLKYAPPGKYHIYKVDHSGLEADDSKLAGEQQRYAKDIEPQRVKKINTVDTTKTADKPRGDEQDWLHWYNTTVKPKKKLGEALKRFTSQ